MHKILKNLGIAGTAFVACGFVQTRYAQGDDDSIFSDNFTLQTSLGYIDVDVKLLTPNPFADAPLTPEITAAISPEYTMELASNAEVVFRADWSFRDDMLGEPSNDPARFTDIDSRSIVNFDVAYHSPDRDWTLALYGHNVADERYDNARLNTGDYVLRILSNDIREFGVRFVREF